jgi:hypothetical protein
MRVVYIVMGKNQLTGEVLIPEFVDDEATERRRAQFGGGKKVAVPPSFKTEKEADAFAATMNQTTEAAGEPYLKFESVAVDLDMRDMVTKGSA